MRDLLLAVGGEAGGAAARASASSSSIVGDRADAGVDGGRGDAAVAQREGEVVVDGHRVVDDRELEDLGDVALGRRQAGDVAVVEEHAALGRARSGPEMMLSSVDLPQPEGPSSA